MVAMHLSLMEVLADSLGPGIKENLEKYWRFYGSNQRNNF